MKKFFSLHTKNAPWGDYGNILLIGIQDSSNENKIIMERTGPFIPDIYESFGNVTIKEDIKNNIEIHFPDIEFVPVIKSKIVYLDWLSWNFESDEPLMSPESGEPEDYINSNEHDELVSQQMGDIWAIKIPIWEGEVYPPRYYLSSDVSDIPYNIFRSEKTLFPVISQNLKEWIENNCGEWVYFIELEMC